MPWGSLFDRLSLVTEGYALSKYISCLSVGTKSAHLEALCADAMATGTPRGIVKATDAVHETAACQCQMWQRFVYKRPNCQTMEINLKSMIIGRTATNKHNKQINFSSWDNNAFNLLPIFSALGKNRLKIAKNVLCVCYVFTDNKGISQWRQLVFPARWHRVRRPGTSTCYKVSNNIQNMATLVHLFQICEN